MRLVLNEPDIPQNAGTLIRLAACLGIGLDIVEPCGFLLDDRRLARAQLDYAAAAEVVRHANWAAFRDARPERLVLLTTRARRRYTDFAFHADDLLLLGSESAGVPEALHRAADTRLRIPLRTGQRSLNVAVAAAMVLGEALRQTAGFPADAVPAAVA